MQTHVHELRTLERPLALREYLGEEVKGEGVQWDQWTSVGDATALRWSLGVLANTLPEADEDIDPFEDALLSVESSKALEEFSYTARLTAFADVGAQHAFQGGASLRTLPHFNALMLDTDRDGEFDDFASALDAHVIGLDLTYGWTDETSQRSLTAGCELLWYSGDVVDVDTDNAALDIENENLQGWFAWADLALDGSRSVGAQYSLVERLDTRGSDAQELEVYFTHMFSEFHRLRFVVGHSDAEGDDALVSAALQYTAIVGAHGHGVNW
jgi:hypothetical protein